MTVGGLINGIEYVFEVRPANALGYGSVETAMATPEEGGVIIFPPPPPPTGNKAPMADAGPDQLSVREGALVTLDGSGSSDPDGDPLRYRWNQISGEPAVLSSQNVANPTFTAPQGLTADAVLSFRLLVTDPEGLFASDTVTITVEQGTSPPGDQIYYFPPSCRGSGLANHDHLYQLLSAGGELPDRFPFRSGNSPDGLVCGTGNGAQSDRRSVVKGIRSPGD